MSDLIQTLRDLASLYADEDPNTPIDEFIVSQAATEIEKLQQRLAEAEKKISEWEAAPEWVKAGDGTLHGAIDYWQDRAHKAEQRLRWILKKCFVNRYAEVSLPCGMTLITDDEIQESIRLIDRAIELKERGEL